MAIQHPKSHTVSESRRAEDFEFAEKTGPVCLGRKCTSPHFRSDEDILGLRQFEGGKPSHGQDGHRGQHGDGQVDVDKLTEGERAYDAGHPRDGRNETVTGGAAGRVVTSAECGDVTGRGMTSLGSGDVIGVENHDVSEEWWRQ